MRKNIKQAFSALINQKSFSTKNQSLSVKDTVLYSYRMPIAWMENDKVMITDQPSPSKTTSCHINGVKFLAR